MRATSTPATAGMSAGRTSIGQARSCAAQAAPARRIGLWSAASALTVLLAFILIALAVAAAPTFPTLTGRIVDQANLLSPSTEAALVSQLAALEDKSTDQIVVVTLPSLQGYTIEDFGYQLGRHWGIGQKDKDNGALLIVAPNERKVRIEVGRGLEPHLTDAMSRIIIENAILPRFRRGDFEGGIVAGIRDMVSVVEGDAEEVKKRASGPRSGGQDDTMALILLAIWIAIFLYIFYLSYRQARHGRPTPTGGMRRRGGFNDRIIVIPGGSSDWSGGGWSGGGGGWSGGGGGFGGGGASGGW